MTPLSARSSTGVCTNRTDDGPRLLLRLVEHPRRRVDGDDVGVWGDAQQRGRRRTGAAAGVEQP